MSQNKKPAAAVLAFRQTYTSHSLQEELQNEGYLVPKAVKDMGQLIGLRSDSIFAKWDTPVFQDETRDAYRELAITTAQLLSWYSVEIISDEAINSVSHRLSASVDPMVSLHSRVDHLFRSFQQEELDHVRNDVQKLWAALEFRCEAVTGQTFSQILKEA